MTRPRTSLVVAAAAGVVAAVAVGLAWGRFDVPTPNDALDAADITVLFLAALAGEWLALPRARGRATTMSVSVIGAAVLMGQSPLLASGLAAAAWGSQAIGAVQRRQSVRLANLPVDVLKAWALAGIVGIAAASDPLGRTIGSSSVTLSGMAAAWLVLVLVGPAVESTELALRADRGRRLRYRDLLRTSWQSDMVLAATATLGALAFPPLGQPSVLLMALPLLAAKLGLERYTDIRKTYDQTLRAMSRLPEQLGAVDPGHGVRVGELAAIAATDLGFSAEVVADVERAAQLHELGRIRSERGVELSPEEVAHAGASIVLEAGGLDRVATLIAAHRVPAPIGNETAWIGGALIRLACDLDRRVHQREQAVLLAEDESWLRNQGVEPRVAEALIRSARQLLAPVPA